MQAAGSDPERWLAATKFQPPVLRPEVIPRPRLHRALQEALGSRRLTLLSAPAGYGKTTLLAGLLGAGDLPVAWVSLDEDDNDPIRFLAAMIASLRRLNPACGMTAQGLLTGFPGVSGVTGTSERASHPRRVIGVLINDILEAVQEPFALILDDLHLIMDPSIYVALDYLLERAPEQMRLLVGTRHDPPLALARLRSRGQLAELRLADLRFSEAEVAALLNSSLRLDLPIDTLNALHGLTEGWAVGLQLLAASLSRIATPAGRAKFIARMPQDARSVHDYLIEEVLRRQDPRIRSFLLETSILAELSPGVCRAITGRPDAGAVLEDLRRRNLFVLAVDESRATYRYHALFAEALRWRLRQELPDRIADLHRRAAEAESVPGRAINHYLAAELWEPAAGLIEQNGQWLLLQGLRETVAAWIRALPEAVRAGRPRLMQYLGMAALYGGEPARAQQLLERAVEGYESAGNREGQGEALADLASCLFEQADFSRSAELIARALSYPLPLRSRVQLLVERAWLAELNRLSEKAPRDLMDALALADGSTDPNVLLPLALHIKPDLTVFPGGFAKVEAFCRHAMQHLGEGITPLRLAIDDLMVFVHLWRGRVDTAIEVGERALANRERLGGYLSFGSNTPAALAYAYLARDDFRNAERAHDCLMQQIEHWHVRDVVLGTALYMVARARALEHRWEEARQLYARACAQQHPRESPESPANRAKLRGLLEMAERRYADAEQTLREALALEASVPMSAIFGSARLLMAQLYHELGRTEDALTYLAPLLAACEADDTPGRILTEGRMIVPLLRLAIKRRVHADFARRLLLLREPPDRSAAAGVADAARPVAPGGEAAAGALPRRPGTTGNARPGSGPALGGVEHLTQREVEILGLIAGGASNREIAYELVISRHTVKSHVAHILEKLNVSSRTQAAARAHELGILPATVRAERSPHPRAGNHS